MINGKVTTLYLENIQPNDIMYWSATSQCYNEFDITLRDNDKIYFNVNKRGNNPELTNLTNGFAFYEGAGDLRLEIIFYNGGEIVKTANVSGNMLDPESKTVGTSYTYCLEDATDNDYNDAYVAVIAWRNAN